VQGEPPERSEPSNGFHDRFSTVAPIAAFLGLVLLLGVFIPPPLDRLLHEAAAFVEVHP
jgi:hydrogenase-4 component F